MSSVSTYLQDHSDALASSASALSDGVPPLVFKPLVPILAGHLADRLTMPPGLLADAGIDPDDEPAVLRALFLACGESLRSGLDPEDVESAVSELRAAVAPVLHNSSALWAQVLESAPLGVILTDHEGRIWDANGAALAALRAPGLGAILGIPLLEVTRAGHSPLNAALTATLSHAISSQARERLNTRFGADFPCEWKLAPLTENGRTAGAVAFLTNAEADDRRAQFSTLGELVAAIAHELNNPLTGILGYAQLLRKVDCEPAVHKRVTLIEEEAQRCRRVIQSILSFARRYDVRHELHDVNALLSQALSDSEALLAQSAVVLEVNVAADMPELTVDAPGVQAAFASIIANACEALATVDRSPRLLQVDSFLEHEFIRIAFRDNGPGMAKEVQRKAFDPFFTTRDADDHPGLGLSLAYSVARQHGGHIQLTANEGQGATFTFVLPLLS